MTKEKVLTCTKCGYIWSSLSTKIMVCCPKCFRKFKREEGLKNDDV